MKFTVRQQLLHALGRSGKTMTCAQLVAETKDISSATVSSALKKMYDDKLVSRVAGTGPRKGYGYKLTQLGTIFYFGIMMKVGLLNISKAFVEQ
jgi:DNA-binding HxlR family transcriptional regulator